LDRRGRIYVANNRVEDDQVFGSATITVYDADAEGDSPPARTISGPLTGLRRPSSITVDREGTIYVLNYDTYTDDHGSVRVYPAGRSHDDRYSRLLIGRTTGFALPEGVAVDRYDTLYVLSRQLSRITVYAPKAYGGAAPIRTLEGPATEVSVPVWSFNGPNAPKSLFLDAADQLYLADPMGASGANAYGPDLGAIRVYRRGAEGNEPPVRRITGGYTKLNGPGSGAVDQRGNVYVPNRFGTGPGSRFMGP
jgi:hypothetical protein